MAHNDINLNNFSNKGVINQHLSITVKSVKLRAGWDNMLDVYTEERWYWPANNEGWYYDSQWTNLYDRNSNKIDNSPNLFYYYLNCLGRDTNIVIKLSSKTTGDREYENNLVVSGVEGTREVIDIIDREKAKWDNLGYTWDYLKSNGILHNSDKIAEYKNKVEKGITNDGKNDSGNKESKEVSDLKKEIQALNEEISGLKKQLEEGQGSSSDAPANWAEFMAKYKALQQTEDSLRKQLREFKNKHRDCEQKEIDALTSRDLARQERDDALEDVKDLENRIKNDYSKRPTLEQFNQVKEDAKKARKKLEERPDITLDEYQNLLNNQEKHSPKDLKPANLPDDWEIRLKELDKWKSDFDGKNSDDAKKELEEANNNLDKAKKSFSDIQEELSKDKDKISQLEKDKENLQEELKDAKDAYDLSEIALTKAEGEKKELSDKVNNFDEKIKELNQEISQLNNDKNKAEKDLNEWTSRFKETPEKVKEKYDAPSGQVLTPDEQDIVDNFKEYRNNYVEIWKQSTKDKINHLVSQFGELLGLDKKEINDIYKKDYEELIDNNFVWDNRSRFEDFSSAIQNVPLKIAVKVAVEEHNKYSPQIDTLSDVVKDRMRLIMSKLDAEIKALPAIGDTENNPFYVSADEVNMNDRISIQGYNAFWRAKAKEMESKIEIPASNRY